MHRYDAGTRTSGFQLNERPCRALPELYSHHHAGDYLLSLTCCRRDRDVQDQMAQLRRASTPFIYRRRPDLLVREPP
jgi:hypothetical protein